MKKLLFLGIIASAFLVGCGSDDAEPVKKPAEEIKAPTTYTQKALIEYFSGAWCPFCPDGKVFFERIENENPEGLVSSVVYHLGDDMDNSYDDAIDSKYSKGYPTGMVNRVGGEGKSRTTWSATAKEVLAQTAKCGLAIDATKNTSGNLNVKVKLGIGAEDLPAGNYTLTVLLVEDEMVGEGTGFDQKNAYNGQAGHPYAGKGDPIKGYVHTNVNRTVLTEALGDKISNDKLVAGTISEFEYSYNVSGLGKDLDVVAFIHESTSNLANPALSSSLIYNVQRTKIGTDKPFD